MAKTLGLDLGTNSIGWALVDNNKIIKMGSRIFPEGVVNIGEGEGREVSKNSSRTEDRGKRRQFFRKRLRKRFLLRELAKAGLCPLDFKEVKQWGKDDFFTNEKLKNWFSLNPYMLRAKAIEQEISLEELGRIFYHMIQRRGFQSNSRSSGAEINEKSTIYVGDNKVHKIGIAQTNESITQHKTLGVYLNSIQPQENEPFVAGLERIRNRYTTRQMYVDEFELIWETQKKFHRELTDDLKTIFGGRKKEGYEKDGVLFHQRPLRSQKHLVGNCSLELKKTKCLLSAICFEEFRVYQWVNTVECNGAKLSKEDKKLIIAQLFSKERVKFKVLRKSIGKLDATYNFNYVDDDTIIGTHTISSLSHKKFFGADWLNFSQKTKDEIWHILYFFEDKDKLKTYALKHWGFDEVKAEAISKFHLKDGYANLSKKAILNILPFLKLGFTYDIAVALGGVKNALGERWEANKDFVLDNLPEIVRSNIKGGYIEPLKKILKEEFDLNEKQLSKLYHHSAAIETTSLLDKLPVDAKADKEIQSIKNPVVITALFELRKIINELIEKYGAIDEVKIEMARDLKTSKTQRNKTRREQKRLENENNRVKEKLDEYGQRHTHENILKYKLWEECKHICPFTGKTIEVNQLFTGEVQIEHIFPWSRSLNDSFMNKTLCFADENRAKGKRTPYEFYSQQGEGKWHEVKTRALSCFSFKKDYPNAYQKFKHFVKKKHDEDFVSRQLNDTRYISKEAKNYVSKICGKVIVAPGQVTAKLRHHWGLNSILNDENEKTRDDHRHHAIDALVMACTTHHHLQELTKWNRYDRKYDLKDFSVPWQGFREQAVMAVEEILVSHKKTDNLLTIRTHKTKRNGKVHTNVGVAVRGQLHKESVFGKRKAPHTKEEAFHIRKPIENLTTKKQLDKVVDSTIRLLIYQRIEQLGGFVKDKIPVGTFYTVDEDGNKIPQIKLPNKNGEPVPVKKIRISENIGGAERLKADLNQYVNPRNNHHVLIYKDKDSKLNEDVVTFWTAVERKRQKQPVVQLPDDGEEMITTLQINDMFLLGLHEEEIDWENPNQKLLQQHLFRVQKFTSGDYYFRKSKESTIHNLEEKQQINSFGEGKNGWITHCPIKVKLSSIGIVEKC